LKTKLILIAALLAASWCLTHRAPAIVAAEVDDEPICVVTHVDVMPTHTVAGRKLLREYANEARKDPGASRVEVFEEVGRPNHSTLVTIWKGRKAFDAHLETESTRAFRGKLQPMLGSPFDERLHKLED
jgi:quinol monooxygenase YgiN